MSITFDIAATPEEAERIAQVFAETFNGLELIDGTAVEILNYRVAP